MNFLCKSALVTTHMNQEGMKWFITHIVKLFWSRIQSWVTMLEAESREGQLAWSLTSGRRDWGESSLEGARHLGGLKFLLVPKERTQSFLTSLLSMGAKENWE